MTLDNRDKKLLMDNGMSEEDFDALVAEQKANRKIRHKVQVKQFVEDHKVALTVAGWWTVGTVAGLAFKHLINKALDDDKEEPKIVEGVETEATDYEHKALEAMDNYLDSEE